MFLTSDAGTTWLARIGATVRASIIFALASDGILFLTTLK
jgi:hypothetical protein